MEPSRTRWGLFLLVVLLPGCSNEEFVRMGMYCAPMSYLLGMASAYQLRQRGTWRPLVMGLPALGLVLSDVLLYRTLSPQQVDKLVELASHLWIGVVLLTALALAGFLGILWRLWFWLSPRTSVEGSALLGSALFFAPGVLLSHGLITDRRTADSLVTGMALVCLYGGIFGGPLVLLGLSIEKWLTKRPDP